MKGTLHSQKAMTAGGLSGGMSPANPVLWSIHFLGSFVTEKHYKQLFVALRNARAWRIVSPNPGNQVNVLSSRFVNSLSALATRVDKSTVVDHLFLVSKF